MSNIEKTYKELSGTTPKKVVVGTDSRKFKPTPSEPYRVARNGRLVLESKKKK